MTSTSLLEAIADARTESAPDTATLPPAASEPGLRLAMHLREVPAQSGGRVLVFIPAGSTGDASPAVGEAIAAFLDMREGPVLIVDLRTDPFGTCTPSWFDSLPTVEHTLLDGGDQRRDDAAHISRPVAHRHERAPYSTTRQFAEQLAEARAHYRYTVYIGTPMPARDTLMAATAADGVVLTVPPGQTTRTEMHDLAAQLRRARAKLVGFVVDPRAARDGRAQ
jgi:hypothetical protein